MEYTDSEHIQSSTTTTIQFNVIDTSKFSLEDLKLFVDSIETISRIERKKYHRKLQQSNSDGTSSSIYTDFDNSDGCNTDIITDDGSNSSISNGKENIIKKIKRRSLSFRNTFAKTCNFTSKILIESHHYNNNNDNNNRYRPRSIVLTDPKKKPTRARIIGLIFKKAGITTNKNSNNNKIESEINNITHTKDDDDDDLSIFTKLPSRCRKPLFIDADNNAEIERALKYLAI